MVLLGSVVSKLSNKILEKKQDVLLRVVYFNRLNCFNTEAAIFTILFLLAVLCFSQMKAFKRSWSDEEFTRAYLDICKNLPPVLRHFFFEKFKEAESWLNARHSYSQSVATSSMGGYRNNFGFITTLIPEYRYLYMIELNCFLSSFNLRGW